MREFLLCREFHWTWRDLSETPNVVVDLFSLYRNARATAEYFESQR